MVHTRTETNVLIPKFLSTVPPTHINREWERINYETTTFKSYDFIRWVFFLRTPKMLSKWNVLCIHFQPNGGGSAELELHRNGKTEKPICVCLYAPLKRNVVPRDVIFREEKSKAVWIDTLIHSNRSKLSEY